MSAPSGSGATTTVDEPTQLNPSPVDNMAKGQPARVSCSLGANPDGITVTTEITQVGIPVVTPQPRWIAPQRRFEWILLGSSLDNAKLIFIDRPAPVAAPYDAPDGRPGAISVRGRVVGREPLAGPDPHVHAVLGGRERAREARVVHARGLIREVEVEGPRTVLVGLEVEIAPGPVGLRPARRVEEGDEEDSPGPPRVPASRYAVNRRGCPDSSKRNTPARSAGRRRPSVVGVSNRTGSSPT